jgi:hypothetical protein
MRKLAVSIIVSGLLVIAPGASAAGPFEPNDSFNTAYGPLSADTTYSGVFETENDADYFYFYLPTLTQMQYQLVTPGDNGIQNSVTIYRAELDGSTDYESYLDVEEGSTGIGAVTLDRGKYFAVVCSGSNCSDAATGDKYSFKILPAGITSTYEPFAAECAAARAPVLGAANALKAAKAKRGNAGRKLRAARNRDAKRRVIGKLRAKFRKRNAEVKAQEAVFESAVAAEGVACSIPQ